MAGDENLKLYASFMLGWVHLTAGNYDDAGASFEGLFQLAEEPAEDFDEQAARHGVVLGLAYSFIERTDGSGGGDRFSVENALDFIEARTDRRDEVYGFLLALFEDCRSAKRESFDCHEQREVIAKQLAEAFAADDQLDLARSNAAKLCDEEDPVACELLDAMEEQ